MTREEFIRGRKAVEQLAEQRKTARDAALRDFDESKHPRVPAGNKSDPEHHKPGSFALGSQLSMPSGFPSPVLADGAGERPLKAPAKGAPGSHEPSSASNEHSQSKPADRMGVRDLSEDPLPRDEMDALPSVPAIYELLQMPAFRQLTRREQQKLLHLLALNDSIGHQALRDLKDILSERGITNRMMTGVLRGLLTLYKETLPETVAGSKDRLQVYRYGFADSVIHIQDIKHFDGFKATKGAAAKLYVVIAGAERVAVYMPEHVSPETAQHTLEEVATALAALPPEVRQYVKRVIVESAQDQRANTYWGHEYGISSMTQYMASGEDGVVHIYPTAPLPTQNQMNVSLLHEVGHICSERAWGANMNSPGWVVWQKAEREDGIAPSHYSERAHQENFAETTALYWKVKGTDEEDELRRGPMKERFKILDQLFHTQP